MGMYSYVQDYEFHIRDKEALKEWLLQGKDECPSYIPKKHINGYTLAKREFNSALGTGDALHEFMSGRKIIGYWYDEFCYFIRDLAMFIDGYVELAYETGEEYAKIIWQDGECRIKMGKVVFSEDSSEITDFTGLQELPRKEKMMRLL